MPVPSRSAAGPGSRVGGDRRLLRGRRAEVGEGARPGDLAGELAGGAEELHLVRVGEGRGEGVAVGGGEAELLPEGSGAAGEEPGVVGSDRGGLGESVASESRSGAAGASGGGDGDAADQGVGAVGARLVAGAADDRAGGVAVDPEVEVRRGASRPARVRSDAARKARRSPRSADIETVGVDATFGGPAWEVAQGETRTRGMGSILARSRPARCPGSHGTRVKCAHCAGLLVGREQARSAIVLAASASIAPSNADLVALFMTGPVRGVLSFALRE